MNSCRDAWHIFGFRSIYLTAFFKQPTQKGFWQLQLPLKQLTDCLKTSWEPSRWLKFYCPFFINCLTQYLCEVIISWYRTFQMWKFTLSCSVSRTAHTVVFKDVSKSRLLLLFTAILISTQYHFLAAASSKFASENFSHCWKKSIQTARLISKWAVRRTLC